MNVNRNYKILIFCIVIIILTGYISLKLLAERYREDDCVLTKISAIIFDLNTFNVEVSGDLKLEDFKIVNKDNHKIIFNKGRAYKGINNDYGEHHTFEVYYKDTLRYEIGYFKYNNWRTYDFILRIDDLKNIVPTLIMNGSDPNKGNIYYKKFERDNEGSVFKIVYFDKDKKAYNEEIINVPK